MVEENEIVLLLFGIVVFIFMIWNRKKLNKLPRPLLIYTVYILFLASWFVTNIETFIFPFTLNILEHLFQAAGGIVLLTWTWKVFIKGDTENYDNNRN